MRGGNVKDERRGGKVKGEKIALSVDDLAAELGISRPTAYELIKRDDFPSVRVSERRILIPVEPLKEWLSKEAKKERRER